MPTVVAALITKDSKLLVCQRKRGDSHELQWEFPGGKVEAGESLNEALLRELREELRIRATVGNEVHRTLHRYDGTSTELTLVFFRASVDDPALLQNLVFERFEWAAPSALPSYDFLPADKELIQLLASNSLRLD